MLKTERNTKSMERNVRSAAAYKFGRGKSMPVFEHGHWWVVTLNDTKDPVWYSVIDTPHGINNTGLDFEQV